MMLLCLRTVYSACSVWGRCDQQCTEANSADARQDSHSDDGVRCSCVSGYRLMADEHTCAVDSGQYTLIHSFNEHINIES